MHFFFAGGDAEMSSLHLGGDVGGTEISFCFFGEVLVVLVKGVWKRVVLLVQEVFRHLQPTGQGQGHIPGNFGRHMWHYVLSRLTVRLAGIILCQSLQ